MSLFYCVVLKHRLIKPLSHSLLTCNFSFLLLCLPLGGGTCSTLDSASRQGPYFRKLVLLYKKVCVHTNDWWNQTVSGLQKEMGRLKLMKACEMSKLNALEKNMFTLDFEYNYCRIFRVWNMVVSFRKRDSMKLLQWILVVLLWNHNKIPS